MMVDRDYRRLGQVQAAPLLQINHSDRRDQPEAKALERRVHKVSGDVGKLTVHERSSAPLVSQRYSRT